MNEPLSEKALVSIEEIANSYRRGMGVSAMGGLVADNIPRLVEEVRRLNLQNDELRKALEALCFPKGKANESCRACGAPSDWPHYPDGPCKVLDSGKTEKRVVPVPLTNQTACCLPHTPGMGCDCGCHRR